jgi:large subunit ribosomal protein L17
LFRNLSIELLQHKRITTTLAKAKELRSYVEPIITKAIKGDLHRKRLIMDDLKNKPVVKELFADIVGTVGERKGGYTRVIRLGKRRGDAADMAIIELVDYNAIVNEQKKASEEAKQASKDEKNKAKAEKAKALEEVKQ